LQVPRHQRDGQVEHVVAHVGIELHLAECDVCPYPIATGRTIRGRVACCACLEM
jgi:hypothetical protein